MHKEYTGILEPLDLSSRATSGVSSMVLKGTMRRKQALKRWCLAEE